MNHLAPPAVNSQSETPGIGLRAERHDAVLWLAIDRPHKRNAVSDLVLDEMRRNIGDVSGEIRAIVVTGSGNKAFCAGADLGELDGGVDVSRPYAAMAQLFRAARMCNVPLIARVNGVCLGGGLGLLAMCDMAVAADHAVFSLPEIKVGHFPSQVFPMLQGSLPRSTLVEMCITGRALSAAEAFDLGLVNYVSSDVDAQTDWLLRQILDQSPATIRRGMYAMKRVASMGFEESISFMEGQAALFALTEDAHEGLTAFREKRLPLWRGK
jgi:enoyl-CoA hydratase/carnithine racemase